MSILKEFIFSCYSALANECLTGHNEFSFSCFYFLPLLNTCFFFIHFSSWFVLILFLFFLFLLWGYCQYNHQALLSSVLFTWFAWCYHAHYGFHCSSRKSGCFFFPQCKYSSVNSHLWVRKNLKEYWAVYFYLTRVLNWFQNSM